MRFQCSMCLDYQVDVKPLPLYIEGSEGTAVCQQCELNVVNYIRATRTAAGKAYKAGYVNGKQRKDGAP